MKLRLKFLGDGIFKAATVTDRAIAAEKLTQDNDFVVDVKQPRSSPQNRLFHAALEEAYENQRGNTYESKEHLRAYALCYVGHRKTSFVPYPINALPEEYAALEDAICQLYEDIREAGRYAFMRKVDGGLALDRPLSWSYAELGHVKATQIAQDVFDFIKEEVVPGVELKALLKAAEKLAA